ncbi:hypothetical protein N7504_006444 [Penicillium tannophilum]|nr:hypothetical protein N7504_006444 [Penicillium tannophilum]
MDDLGSVYDDDGEDIEGEGSDDDKVIFNESDVPFDKEMVDFSGFSDKEAEVIAPSPIIKKAAKKAVKEEKVEKDKEDAFNMDVSDDETFLDSDDDLLSDMELGGVEVPTEAPSDLKKRRKLKHLTTTTTRLFLQTKTRICKLTCLCLLCTFVSLFLFPK